MDEGSQLSKRKATSSILRNMLLAHPLIQLPVDSKIPHTIPFLLKKKKRLVSVTLSIQITPPALRSAFCYCSCDLFTAFLACAKKSGKNLIRIIRAMQGELRGIAAAAVPACTAVPVATADVRLTFSSFPARQEDFLAGAKQSCEGVGRTATAAGAGEFNINAVHIDSDCSGDGDGLLILDFASCSGGACFESPPDGRIQLL